MPLTKETWFNGVLNLTQPRDGYRYTIDPLILCALVRPILSPPAIPGQILDIGCGCGIIPLILGYRHPDVAITGVELQGDLAAIAARNIAENSLGHRIRIIHGDITRLELKDIALPADLILSNPPYRKLGTGRVNPHNGKALARHELTLTIDQLYQKAAQIIAPAGRVCIIFPAERLSDLESSVQAAGFFVEWICYACQTRGQEPFRVVVSVTKDPEVSRQVRPPFILFEKDGSPTKAHKDLFNP